MPKGYYTYESFFADTSLFGVIGPSLGTTFGTAYKLTVNGRIMGMRMFVNAIGDNKGLVFYLLETTDAGAVQSLHAAVTDLRNYNGSVPGFRNVYLQHPLRVNTAWRYRVCVFGALENNGIWKGALAAGSVTHGHITAVQDNVPAGQRNSAAATTARYPNAAPSSGAGDMYGLDLLFLPD